MFHRLNRFKVCAGLPVHGSTRACNLSSVASGVNDTTFVRCKPSRANQFELLEPPDPIFGAELLPIVAEPRLSRAEHLLIGP